MMELLYRWLPRIFGCHCRKDRSFHYKGHQFPLCARCTGEVVGLLICPILFLFWKPTVLLSVFLMLPLILDGFIQALTSYESTNLRRFVTGFLFSLGLASLFVRSSAFVYGLGKQYGHAHRI